MAPRYRRPSGEVTGAQASCRSGTAMVPRPQAAGLMQPAAAHLRRVSVPGYPPIGNP